MSACDSIGSTWTQGRSNSDGRFPLKVDCHDVHVTMLRAKMFVEGMNERVS